MHANSRKIIVEFENSLSSKTEEELDSMVNEANLGSMVGWYSRRLQSIRALEVLEFGRRAIHEYDLENIDRLREIFADGQEAKYQIERYCELVQLRGQPSIYEEVFPEPSPVETE